MILVIMVNLTVLCFIIYRSVKKSSNNILLSSLCIADLCVGIFVIPNQIFIVSTILEWSPIMCKMCLYMEFTAAFASSMTLTCIAIDRFRAIISPIKYKQTKEKVSKITAVIVWISAFLYSFRALFVYDVIEAEITTDNVTFIEKRCIVPINIQPYHNALIITDFILLFGVPGIVLFVTNIVVSVYLNKRKLSNSDQMTQKRQKTIRLLIAMVAIFVTCHLPLFVIRLRMLTHTVENGIIWIRSFLVLSFINSFINVFFYSSLNEDVNNLRNMILNRICFAGQERMTSTVHPLTASVINLT